MATKPAIIQQIEDQCGFPLTRLENLPEPSDAVRYPHNNSYHCDAQGVLRAINVSESDGLKSVVLTAECAGLQYLNLSENKNLAELRFELPLKELAYLDLSECALAELDFPAGFDALGKAYLQKNKLTQVSFQGGCGALVLLDLSGNQLISFKLPRGFDSLAYLYLSENQIQEIALSAQIDKLDTLHLRGNKLRYIEVGQSFSELRSLYLEDNQLSTLPDNLFESLPNLAYLTLKGNAIGNIPKEISEKDGNVVTDVRNTLISQSKGTVENNEVKMVLVGNSSVGKTTLIKFLQDGEFIEGENTTHGIKVSEWKPEKEKGKSTEITVYAWDFGGQEYYHATHRLFLSNNAVYCLLWNKATNVQDLVKTTIHKKGKPEEQELEHYPYTYWLDNIRQYASNSPILLVQSRDKDIETVDSQVFEQYGIAPKKNYSVCVGSVYAGDEDKTDEFNIFRRNLIGQLEKATTSFKLGKFWAAIRDKIRAKAKKGEHRWTWQVYEEFCRDTDPTMDASELGTLTRYLTDIGVILHYPKYPGLKDTVFIKPVWVTDMIYDIFDERVKKRDGEFDLGHMMQVLQENGAAQTAENQQQLSLELLDLMQEFELIFSPQNKPDSYFAIQYLSNKYHTPGALERHKKLIPVLAFKLYYPKFLSKTVFHRFVAAYGKYVKDEFWKYGIFFTHEPSGIEVFAECKFSDKTIEVWMHRADPMVQSDLFQRLFQLSEENKEMLVSANGVDFASIEKIEEANKYKHEEFKADIGETVQLSDFDWLLMKGERGLHGEERFAKDKLIKPEKDIQQMEDIKKLIGDARLKAAVEALVSRVSAQHKNAALQLQGRLNTLENKVLNGVISSENERLERNEISFVALKLCDDANNPAQNTIQKEEDILPVSENANIYFSYAWGDQNETGESREKIVNDLYDSLISDGFPVQRDSMNIEYGGLISQFMEKIGQGDLIVVFISDKYARSPYCMFELYEIARNNKLEKQLFAGRILPIAVERIRFDDPEVLEGYFEHWEKEESKWVNLIQKRIGQINEAQMKRYNNTKVINQNFGNLSDWLADMNAKTRTILHEDDFAEVKNAILARLKMLSKGQ